MNVDGLRFYVRCTFLQHTHTLAHVLQAWIYSTVKKNSTCTNLVCVCSFHFARKVYWSRVFLFPAPPAMLRSFRLTITSQYRSDSHGTGTNTALHTATTSVCSMWKTKLDTVEGHDYTMLLPSVLSPSSVFRVIRIDYCNVLSVVWAGMSIPTVTGRPRVDISRVG